MIPVVKFAAVLFIVFWIYAFYKVCKQQHDYMPRHRNSWFGNLFESMLGAVAGMMLVIVIAALLIVLFGK